MARDLTAVRSVGALLPADLLSRVAAGDPDLGGFSGRDYHLAAGESPREAANRAWAYLSGVWPSFQDALARLPEGDPAVGLTRERWLQVVFRELGYGRLQTTPAGGIAVAGKSFPVSHSWGATPIHLLGWGVDLDRRTKGVPGAAERAPHAMVQELLNRSDDHLWAVVSNGRVLRLLRDSTSLSTQSYVEFDLEAIFTGELFADFVVLFLLLHQSRVEVLGEDAPPSECWLERWRSSAITTGARALSLLSDGVQQAIADLGTGFLRSNTRLRAALDDKSLALDDYHQALLRLVYRMLVLFVAEDRQALHPEDADPVARARYAEYFSTARLRRLALRRRGTRHGDLWQAQRLVLQRLGQDDGCPELALPGLGGVFDDDGTELFADAELPNDALLSAVRHLSTVRPKGQPLRTVDYKNLGAEELGSIYESLLELIPRYQRTEQAFSLELLAGNDRKTTGSYYTPSSLIDLVLDETLTPLLDEAEKQPDPEAALLAMTVCDPACGSGHFLVAAARRIAERLAVVRTGEIDPTPADLQDALYDVVGSCIYGVDLNPLAADLAKVSLWLESMRPGRPLTFLDAHIKVGNALLGTNPALLANGIPDDAYAALAGDDKSYAAALRKRNKGERETTAVGSLFELTEIGTSTIDLRGRLSQAVAPAGGTPRLREVHAAQRAYYQFQTSPELARERLQADSWCAAFVQAKRPGGTGITGATLEAIREGSAPDEIVREVQRLAAQFRFFHWHLEFPDVFDTSRPRGKQGWSGGFNAVVGNPPWETVQMSEKEFFASRDLKVAHAPTTAARKAEIAKLVTSNPQLMAEFENASRAGAGEAHFIRKSGRYPTSAHGKLNTYSTFAELFQSLVAGDGYMGIITPTGLATGVNTAEFFAGATSGGRLTAFYDFANHVGRFFPGLKGQSWFAVSVISGGRKTSSLQLSVNAGSVEEARRTKYVLSPDEVALVNPTTGTLPMFRSRRDAEIVLRIYARHSAMRTPASNPWGLRYQQGLFNMSTDSNLFKERAALEALGAGWNGWSWCHGSSEWLPLYEPKMVHLYHHRFGDYKDVVLAPGKEVRALPTPPDVVLDSVNYEPTARHWVIFKEVNASLPPDWSRGWLVGWRDVANVTNERTLIPAVIPRSAVGHVFPLAFFDNPDNAPLWLATAGSLVHDYVARQKLSGSHLTYPVIDQLAMPDPDAFRKPLAGVSVGALREWIVTRVVELTYTSARMKDFAADFARGSRSMRVDPPFRWRPRRRAALQAEIDAAMFLLYGVGRQEVAHILESFASMRKHEERDCGEFRTRRLVLETYDAMTAAAETGTIYVSPLDPPPGHGPRHDA